MSSLLSDYQIDQHIPNRSAERVDPFYHDLTWPGKGGELVGGIPDY